MKKLTALIFLTFAIFILSGLVSAASYASYADTEDANFQKAGEAMLADKEAALNTLKIRIETYTEEMAKDGVITGREMKQLDRLLKQFKKIQKESDEYLRFYGLATNTIVPFKIIKVRDVYYDSPTRNHRLLNFGDDEKQSVKQFFVGKTGKDITIKPSPFYGARIFFGIIAGFVMLIAGLFVATKLNLSADIWLLMILFGPFAIGLCIFLFIIP